MESQQIDSSEGVLRYFSLGLFKAMTHGWQTPEKLILVISLNYFVEYKKCDDGNYYSYLRILGTFIYGYRWLWLFLKLELIILWQYGFLYLYIFVLTTLKLVPNSKNLRINECKGWKCSEIIGGSMYQNCLLDMHLFICNLKCLLIITFVGLGIDLWQTFSLIFCACQTTVLVFIDSVHKLFYKWFPVLNDVLTI